jgi:DNA repair exonuclease SbcCD ATPase subunit
MHLRAFSPLFVLLLATLGACSSCPRDPTQAGFFCGVNNAVLTDTYDEDQAALEAELAAAEQRAAELKEEAERLERLKAGLDVERREAAGRLESANRELSQLIARLDEATRQQGVDRQRLRELREREEVLSQRQLGLSKSGDVTPQELAAIEAANARLSADIDELLASL